VASKSVVVVDPLPKDVSLLPLELFDVAEDGSIATLDVHRGL
jgi:hypothetical protein